jgi:hypothetical protein
MGIRQPPASRRGANPTRPASLVASGARRNSGRRGGALHQGTSAVTPDEVRLDDLPERLVVDVGASFQALGAVPRDRLGLYRALLAVLPAAPADVAR